MSFTESEEEVNGGNTQAIECIVRSRTLADTAGRGYSFTLQKAAEIPSSFHTWNYLISTAI